MEKAGITKLVVPADYVVGSTIARTIVLPSTGEILVESNSEVTLEMLLMLQKNDIKQIETLYTNDIDCGPFISDTLRIDGTISQLDALVEIYRPFCFNS